MDRKAGMFGGFVFSFLLSFHLKNKNEGPENIRSLVEAVHDSCSS